MASGRNERQHGTRGRTPRPHRGPRTAAQAGVTLVELMVTVVVLGVVLAVGVPSMAGLMAANRAAAQTNDIVGALQLARSEAVRQGVSVALRANDTANHDFAGGWKVFTDANEDGAIPGTPTDSDGTVLREQGAGRGGIVVARVTRSDPPAPFTYTVATSADRDHVVFNARGTVAAGSTLYFRICPTNTPSVKGRVIQVTPVGRVSLVSADIPC